MRFSTVACVDQIGEDVDGIVMTSAGVHACCFEETAVAGVPPSWLLYLCRIMHSYAVLPCERRTAAAI